MYGYVLFVWLAVSSPFGEGHCISLCPCSLQANMTSLCQSLCKATARLHCYYCCRYCLLLPLTTTTTTSTVAATTATLQHQSLFQFIVRTSASGNWFWDRQVVGWTPESGSNCTLPPTPAPYPLHPHPHPQEEGNGLGAWQAHGKNPTAGQKTKQSNNNKVATSK